MSRCPNCDTPLHITRAASPVIESESAYTYRTGVLMQQTPPKSSETEKVPTPASDSVKGEHCPHSATTEKDRHGRSIIARNDYAMVVRTSEPENDQPYLITDTKSEFFWSGQGWLTEEDGDLPHTGNLFREESMVKLANAAATPLPTAKETPKVQTLQYSPDADWRDDKARIETDVEGLCHTMREHEERLKEIEKIIDGFHTPAEFSDLRLRVSDLEREVAALKAASRNYATRPKFDPDKCRCDFSNPNYKPCANCAGRP